MPFVEPGLVLGSLDSALHAVTLSSSAAATARSRFSPRGWCAASVHALDVDASTLPIARRRAAEAGLRNIVFMLRDFVSDGTGLPAGSVDCAVIFNILHHEDRNGRRQRSPLAARIRNLSSG